MAKFSDVNSIGTGAAAMFKLKAVLKSAGWTVPRSSDGTTYNSSGDQITVATSGAGGMANNSAWFVVKEPGNRREWCIQRGTSGNTAWRITYSALAGHTGGTPGATRVATATDGQVLIGGGSDASPTFSSVFPTDSTYRVHIVANSTPIGGVYPFSVFCTATPGSSNGLGNLWQEPMAPGSYDAADVDPCIVGVDSGGSGIAQVLSTSSKCWLAYGTGSAVFGSIVSGVNATFNGSLPSDLASNKDVNGRPLYTFSSGGTRIKGYGALIAVKGPSRAYPATANRTVDAYVYVGTVVVPYADNTEPGV